MKLRWAVKSVYGYWKRGRTETWTTDLQHCDLFRFKLTTFLAYVDQIFNGSKIVPIFMEV